jgi:hypothetical protein
MPTLRRRGSTIAGRAGRRRVRRSRLNINGLKRKQDLSKVLLSICMGNTNAQGTRTHLLYHIQEALCLQVTGHNVSRGGLV